MNNGFIDDCKKDIMDRLEDYKDTEHYLCDIGFMLTEGENVNGSWYCNSSMAESELFNNHEVFGYIWNECKFQFGPDFMGDLNPFDDAERVHVVLMIELYRMLFDMAVSDFDEWNDLVTIDDDFIERVREALDDVDLII